MNDTPRPGKRRLRSVAALSCCATLLACSTAALKPLPTVDAVDLPRYAGDWYEIARLPNVFQSACASDTMARYSLQPDGVSVLNRCRRADGSVDAIEGHATIVDGSTGSRLKVTFFWPFRGDYWVLALDPSYRFVLVGEPRRHYAWVLSRTPSLDPPALEMLLRKAADLGFDRDRFVQTPQRQPLPAAP